MAVNYLGASEIKGSTITVFAPNAFLGEGAIVTIGEERRIGQVIAISGDNAVIQVFKGTEGFSLINTATQLRGEPFTITLEEGILGRTFDGLGRPIDNLGSPKGTKKEVDTPAINPINRDYPREYIQTGISAIDLLVTLVRGQKLPIFSVQGLSHNKLAAQLVAQAAGENYIVFAGIGLKFDTFTFFKNSFKEMGNADKLVTFLNLAESPVAERLITPKVALTAAEYLAFKLGKHVIVILIDMTSYCEALRELSATLGEIPGRRGYPSYMYSQLSNIYERAGKIKGRSGSVTLIPILTMPGGDITHPIPDLTGFITEGQIVLDQNIKVYPPINVLPSLSRLMKDAIGKGMTTVYHPKLSKDIFAAYSKVGYIRELSQIIGIEELSDEDRAYLKFGKDFETLLVSQGYTENRTIQQTMAIANSIVAQLFKSLQ